MKQSKRQARDRNRQAAMRAQKDGNATGNSCPTCKTQAQPDDNFCRRCGARLDGQAAPRRWHTPTLALYGVIGLAVIVVVAGVAFISGQNRAVAPPPVSQAPAQGGGGPAVDLSAMSPREAADRLFNRVVMASEQGNMDEALQFAPMAAEAYERVERMDADAHYHLGLIYSVMDDLEAMRNQVSIIKQYTPNHLLALLLEHEIAEKEGNAFAAAQAAEAFAEAYEEEIRAGRPEYEAHRNTIEAFRAHNTDR